MLAVDDVVRAPGTGSSIVPLRSAEWPVWGRQQALSDIMTALTETAGGVLVTGHPGMGKTLLATHALKELTGDPLIISLRCSAALARSPYGALNVLLNDLEPAYLEHPVLVLSGLIRLLRERGRGRTVYLLLDDAGEIDELTAVAVAQIARNGTARIVLTCSVPHRLSAELSGLREDGYLTRIDLKPLSFQDAVEWLEEGMGAKVSHAAVRNLWTTSGGNPQYLKLLALQHAKAGSLGLHDGVWVLSAGSRNHGTAITDLIATHLGKLAITGRSVLEILSMADTVPLEILLNLADADDVDALEELGLLAVEDSISRRVRIQNRLVADVVRQRVPLGRSSQLRQMVMAAARQVRPQPAMDLSLASWALDCGAVLEPETALAAAKIANNSWDPHLALRLVRAIPGRETAAPAVIEEAAALVVLGKPEEAMQVLHHHRQLCPNAPNSLTTAGLLLAESGAQRARPGCAGRSDECLAKARGILYPETGNMPENRPGQVQGEAHRLQGFRQRLVLGELAAEGDRGRYRDLAARINIEFASGNIYSQESRLVASSWLCEAWALTGRQTEAQELGNHLQVQCVRPGIAPAAAHAALTRVHYACLLSGSWDEAAETLKTVNLIPTSGFDENRHATDVWEAISVCFQGRGRDALELLVPAISQLRIKDSDGVIGLATAAAAYAAALQGNSDRATELLRRGGPSTWTVPWKLSRTVKYFTALARAETGERLAAADDLVRLADEDRNAGTVSHEMLCLSSAVRLGNRAIAGRLLEAARRNQGPLAGVCNVYARAVLTGSPVGLLAAAELAVDIQNDRFALDIAESVLESDPQLLDRNLTHQAKQIVASCRHRLRAPQSADEGVQTLTDRELQIARLAAGGVSNKSIASELHVSIRTVEGHLYKVYGKLKISERLELKLALEGQEDELR